MHLNESCITGEAPLTGCWLSPQTGTSCVLHVSRRVLKLEAYLSLVKLLMEMTERHICV